ncbi:MAG TPA: aminoacyl-tRNA hydrolase [Saprospiraceae bacterium]|nr:aminoacyl-tRNA hydrolase [Saprospiraceae bacterium]HPR01318.1 aminoacyl-tRNA hydrolase [Saprospiraceae bacterium]HRV85805.1 aminoacyl-tRNA hydrolase [Saprospiraceae bacterium]
MGWLTKWFKPKEETDRTMKYLIVGLGNIGNEYRHTRHNAGFLVVEALAEHLGATFQEGRYGAMAQASFKGRKLWLLKPNTYMNRSGQAIRYWLDKEKIPLENLLVVVDEIQLPFGQLRLRKKGSDGGHNGLKSIQEQLQSTEYNRLRIGIGNDFNRGQQIDYVLGEWSNEEKDGFPEIRTLGIDIIKSFIAIGADRTMSQYNG